MFELTRQERAVLVFIAIAILLGISIRFGLKKFAKLQPIYNLDLELNSKANLKIDINSADVGQLSRLPGIGSVLAGRIVEYRRLHGVFKDIDDLQKIRGIGSKNINKFRDYLAIGQQNNKSN